MDERNITAHDHLVTQEDRRASLGQSGMVIWMTGLSGSGKSTIGAALERELVARGFAAYMLDGDNLRHGLCSELGFSDADRAENLRRIAEAAALLADAGVIAIVSAISPKQENRDAARAIVCRHVGENEQQGAGRFVEAYIKANVLTCESRDPKGLYRLARSGKITGFTGVSAPYEVPERADIVLDTESMSAKDCVERLLALVAERQNDLEGVVYTAVCAAIKAGSAIMDVYSGNIEVEYKDDASPLTVADKRADAIIAELLTLAYPHIPILSEESADDPARLAEHDVFIVDPLDGTKEFIKKNGEFTVNIALCRGKKPVAGVIFVPASGKLYYAAKGRGAFAVYAEKLGGDAELFRESDRISVTDRLASLRAVGSRSHSGDKDKAVFESFGDKIESVSPVGSSIKGCRVAEGSAELYYRFGPVNEWDIAAMQAIVECAGGVMRRADGGEITYNNENPLKTEGFHAVNRAENEVIL